MGEVRISAILPVYNGEVSLARAIDSVLAQRARDFELIAVDDGSTDRTPEILRRYADRIRIIHVAHKGPAVARNTGVAASRGRYLAFLDADDAWLPDFLGKTAAALEQSPAAVLAFSDIVPVDPKGAPAAHFLPDGEPLYAPAMKELLTKWWPILTSAVVMSKRVFELCGGFAREFTAPGYEDPWLWLRAREHGEFVCVNEPLVVYTMISELQRMEKYMRGFKIFSRLVRARYGAAGMELVNNLCSAHESSLGFKGLLHLQLGDMDLARRSFACALRYRPASQNVLRLARTFLPHRFACMLSGRTRFLSRAQAQRLFGTVFVPVRD